ncbi:hypothetical protein [Nocardia sp. NPDC052566]|uniref:hypothetical protein n=1 Tax=Nocardia sp. NPDC052566 TaxID=3364330 RepID=UPI0037C8FF4F
MRQRVLVAVAATFTFTSAVAAVAHAEPGRTERVVENWGGIEVREIVLDSPMLPAAGPQPPECQRLSYLRYRMTDGPEDPQRADAVLVMQPGAVGAAYSLDRVARNTLGQLATQGKKAEWWSINRRGVCQQDDTGLAAAAAAGDYRIALDYYYNNRDIDGRRFGGWRGLLGDRRSADFGLAQTVRDQYELMTRELPDREFRASKTLCGGHSHGGLMVGVFGAWDFTGDPADAGYNQCAGWVAIDTLVTADPVGLEVDPILKSLAAAAGPLPYAATTALLKAGLAPNDAALLPFFNPKSVQSLSIAGLAANFAPRDETELTRQLPLDWQLGSTFRGMATNYQDFLTGQNGPLSYRYTNQALLGEIIDDNSMTAGLYQFSVGTLDGGPVTERVFPVPGDTADTSPLGPLIGFELGHGKRVAPTDHGALYDWADYRRTPDTFYTSRSREVVDIADLARILSSGLPFTETYFPTRFVYDTFFALAGTRSDDLAPIRYEAEVMRKPMLTLNGDKSVVKDMLDIREIAAKVFTGAPNIERVMIPNYTHLDMILGAATQNDGRPDQVGVSIADFTTRTIR